MTPTSNPTAAVLVIGNEILSGRTQDANLNYIAKKLTSIGIPLAEARVVADREGDIVDAVNILRKRYTYVFTTGGIGPTHDDITADSIGKAFGVKVSENAEARAKLMSYYTTTPINEARLRMARVPEGAALIQNAVSAAPGFRIENVYVLAGVPSIAQAMMDEIVAGIKHGPAIHSVSVSGYVAESVIAADLAAVALRYPQLDIGSYPWSKNGRWGTALVTRGIERLIVEKAAHEILGLVKNYDPEPEVEATPPVG